MDDDLTKKLLDELKALRERVDSVFALLKQPISEFFSTAEAAVYLKVTKAWVYDRTRAGADDPIPHLKIGRYLRFRRKDLDRWIEKKRVYD